MFFLFFLSLQTPTVAIEFQSRSNDQGCWAFVHFNGVIYEKEICTNCRCGVECVVHTVSDPMNPNCGRKFFGCRNYKNNFDKGCSFFRFVDDEVVDGRDFKMEKLRRKNVMLRVELSKTKKLLKGSVVLGLFCFGLSLVLSTFILCNAGGRCGQLYLK